MSTTSRGQGGPMVTGTNIDIVCFKNEASLLSL